MPRKPNKIFFFRREKHPGPRRKIRWRYAIGICARTRAHLRYFFRHCLAHPSTLSRRPLYGSIRKSLFLSLLPPSLACLRRLPIVVLGVKIQNWSILYREIIEGVSDLYGNAAVSSVSRLFFLSASSMFPDYLQPFYSQESAKPNELPAVCCHNSSWQASDGSGTDKPATTGACASFKGTW